MIKVAKDISAHAKGRYIISNPDFTGNVDSLAHLRGSANVMLDMLDGNDEAVLNALSKIQKAWELFMTDFYNAVKENNGGGSSVGWLKIYSQGRFAQMQSDISVMISNDLFKKFVMPELHAQTEFLEHSLYHFDGVEQTMHLDDMLSVPGLDIIQWQKVDAQNSPVYYIDWLKKIQAAGKCITVQLQPDEIEPLMTQLSSKGLHIRVETESKDDAVFAYKQIQKFTKE